MPAVTVQLRGCSNAALFVGADRPMLRQYGTAIPVPAWRDPEGSSRLSLPGLLDKARLSALRPPAAIPGTHFC